ncbi:MAG: hypothetical protein ABEK00_02230 [Candidatus Nanohaloarchaea archaeon]
MDKEKREAYRKQANVKKMIKQQQDKQESFRKMILGQDQWKQEVMNGLLNIRRRTEVVEDEEGRTVLQDFIKLENGSGRWKQPKHLSERELDEIKSGGIVNEKGAKFIIGHLNSVDNNNIALSNMDQAKINKVCREAENSLRNILTNRRKEFGIESPADRRQIVASIVRPNMSANFSKAKNGQFVKELLRQTRMMGSLDDEEEDEGWRSAFS